MFVTFRFVHAQKVPDNGIHDVYALLLYAIAVVFLVKDALLDESLAY